MAERGVYEQYVRDRLDDILIVSSVIAPDGDIGAFLDEQVEHSFLRLSEMGLVRRGQDSE